MLENRYRMGRMLGSGGMGAVFEARHLRLDRPVAIKVLRPAYATEKEYIERFLREAKSASSIRHRNVVEILDYGETEGGLVYSVMEFLVGEDLEELLRAQPDRRLPWARACGLLIQVSSGLKAAHGQGVIHRDIKPANCFLTDEDGEPVVKLVDFGIAKLEGIDRGHTLTGTAQVLGTPSYIAPELVRSQDPANARSDIYALGVLAYRMLVGKVPFAASTVFELLRKACFDPVPSMRERVPDVPVGVEALILEMMAKEPKERPLDMLEVRDRLIALSRRTLGMLPMTTPSSSGIPLAVADSVPPPEEATTTPQRGPGGFAGRVRPLEDGATEVAIEAIPTAAQRSASAPQKAPQTVVVSPSAGAPVAVVHDPHSSPSRSGETVPALGESTLRSMESSGSIEGPRRQRGPLMLFAGLAAAGALIIPQMLGNDGTDGDGHAAEIGLAVQTASTGPMDASTPPGRDLEGLSGGMDPNVGVEDIPTPEATDARTIASTGGEPHGNESSPSTSGEEEREGEEPDPEPMTSMAEDSESSASTSPDEGPSSGPTPKASPKKWRSESPPRPPSDATLAKRLKRKIKAGCMEHLGGKSVTVSFFVSEEGTINLMTANRKDEAGRCAKDKIRGTVFRTRPKETLNKIMVE